MGPNKAPRKKHGLKNIKRRNSYFSVSITAPKKTLVQKEYEVQKIWNSYFSGQTLCRKKKSYKKSTGSKKRNSYFWVLFCQINPFFQHFFIWTDIRFKQKKKVPAKKAPKSMSSFSWNPSFFWGSYFGQDNVWPEKSTRSLVFWNSYFFFVTSTFLAQCSSRKNT